MTINIDTNDILGVLLGLVLGKITWAWCEMMARKYPIWKPTPEPREKGGKL